MFRRTITVLAAVGISVTALTVVVPATVLAYPPCASASTASVSSPTVAPGGTVTFSVTLKDCSGVAVAGSTVVFTSTGPGPCRATFNPPTAITDAGGQAPTTVTFPPACPGQFTLAGTTQGITVTAAVRETGGFPLTSGGSASDRAPLPIPGLLVMALGLVLVAGGSAALLRRR